MEGMMLSSSSSSSVSAPHDEEEIEKSIYMFLLIARGQTAATARHFLESTNWNLMEALERYLSGDYDYDDPNMCEDVDEPTPTQDYVYSLEPMKRVLESDLGGAAASASTAETTDNLASLYRPPIHLIFNASFNKAKHAASMQDKWLLANIQSTKEFTSLMLNRDTWANDAVSQIIRTNFIFWQVYDDTSKAKKVCTYYRLDSIPVVLIINPITGQKMHSWEGMVQPESLLEGLLTFLDAGPKDHHTTLSYKSPGGSSSPPKTKATVDSDASKEEDEEVHRALAASFESVKESSEMAGGDNKDANVAGNLQETAVSKFPAYPTLPEEPKERNRFCRVSLRLPDGRLAHQNFLPSEPIQLLWSFVAAQLDETKPFKLTPAIPEGFPGASKKLDYESNSTFEESGLANSLISVTWD